MQNMLSSNSGYNKETFDIEIEGWCYGLKNFPGEISTELVSALLDEVSPCFKAMIESGETFDVVDVAQKFTDASHYIVDQYTITELICQKFPNPNFIQNEDELYIIAMILDSVEKQYPGLYAVMEQFWNAQSEQLIVA